MPESSVPKSFLSHFFHWGRFATKSQTHCVQFDQVSRWGHRGNPTGQQIQVQHIKGSSTVLHKLLRFLNHSFSRNCREIFLKESSNLREFEICLIALLILHATANFRLQIGLAQNRNATNSFGKKLTNLSRPLQGLLGDACQPKAWPFCRKCDNCAASCEFGKHKTTTARLTIASTTRLQVSGLPACLRKLCVYSVYNPCIYIFNISIRDHSWSCVLVTINLSASLSISPQNVYLKIDQHCSSLLHASRCRDQHFYQNQAVVQVECGISIFYMEKWGGGEQPDHVLHVMFNFNSHAPLLN